MSSPLQPDHSPSPASNPVPRLNVLQKVLAWLRAGYPRGIPQSDYVALLAVLHRRLTEYEIHLVVRELVHERTDPSGIEQVDIEAAIARVAVEQPGQDDIARVASRLAAGGWPLAAPTLS